MMVSTACFNWVANWSHHHCHRPAPILLLMAKGSFDIHLSLEHDGLISLEQ